MKRREFPGEMKANEIRTQYGLMAFSALLALAILTPGRAVADGDDPPSRVARLSLTDGQVSFSPAGTDDGWARS